MYSGHKQGFWAEHFWVFEDGSVRFNFSKITYFDKSKLLPFAVLNKQQTISSVSPFYCISELSGFPSYMAIHIVFTYKTFATLLIYCFLNLK